MLPTVARLKLNRSGESPLGGPAFAPPTVEIRSASRGVNYGQCPPRAPPPVSSSPCCSKRPVRCRKARIGPAGVAAARTLDFEPRHRTCGGLCHSRTDDAFAEDIQNHFDSQFIHIKPYAERGDTLRGAAGHGRRHAPRYSHRSGESYGTSGPNKPLVPHTAVARRPLFTDSSVQFTAGYAPR